MYPSGTVTFLFTDIEGSTRLWEQHPQAMNKALAQHDAILRQAVESHGGIIVKTTGDGLHAAFDTALDGLSAGLAAQQALLACSWAETGPLRVRMALHSGEAEFRGGDYYGPAVNRAARLMALAAGSQVLLSATTAGLVQDRLPEGVDLADLGRHHLEDLARPERVFQLRHPDLPADFAPLPSLTSPNNLPAQLTSFVGRERELAEVRQLLAPDDPPGTAPGTGSRSRLVTLTGPGGTGKTRLSLQAAAGLLDHFPDGIWLVELAPLTDPQLLVHSVAAPLGLQELPGRPLLAMLIDYLRPQQVLLLLDNCEHLIDACAQLAGDLLQACPRLRILASSREALGIIGEQAYRLRSMALPPDRDDLSAGQLAGFEAVRLFVERAAAIKPDFSLDQNNAVAIAQICRRLDGIPLAIELAASRVLALAPQQIAQRLHDRFRLLTGGSRTALPRQRTLQALIDWSYDLLSEAERVLLRRLSVFAGGWTLEAAEAVAGVPPLEAYEVLDLLEQLVNKSLAAAEEGPWGMRYRLLETVRQYAQEKLAASGEADPVRDGHLAYFVEQNSLAWEARLELRRAGLTGKLIEEGENLRAARAWALDRDLRAALLLVVATGTPMSRVVSTAEALKYAHSALALAESDPDFSGTGAKPEQRRLVGHALSSTANIFIGSGLNNQGLEYARRAIAVARREDDTRGLAWATGLASIAAFALGDLESARQYQQESLSLGRQSGAHFAAAMALISIRGAVFPDGPKSQEVALTEWEEGMAMMRRGGDLWGQAMGHQIRATMAMHAGDSEAARFHAERSLALFIESGDRLFTNIPRSILAELARGRGDYAQAASAYLEIGRVWRDGGHMGAVARCLECLAFIAHAESGAGRPEDKWPEDKWPEDKWPEDEWPEDERPEDGRPEDRLLDYAATLLGAAEAIRQTHHTPMAFGEVPEYQAEMSAIRDTAGEAAFQAAWRRGQVMNQDQALAFAGQEKPGRPD